MLTISKPLSAGQARSYHEKEFANAEQNYYSQKGGVQGEWTGKFAADWGLAGAVGAGKNPRPQVSAPACASAVVHRTR